MRSSRVIRASGCQCRSRNYPGFDPSILRHSGIWGAAKEAVLNIVQISDPCVAVVNSTLLEYSVLLLQDQDAGCA
jgi:hypothetical protein